MHAYVLICNETFKFTAAESITWARVCIRKHHYLKNQCRVGVQAYIIFILFSYLIINLSFSATESKVWTRMCWQDQ